jgi:hypothetical protein
VIESLLIRRNRWRRIVYSSLSSLGLIIEDSGIWFRPENVNEE